jgi:hypothetical protein
MNKLYDSCLAVIVLFYAEQKNDRNKTRSVLPQQFQSDVKML